MDSIQFFLRENLIDYFNQAYPEILEVNFTFQPTNKEHEGDLTLMVFPLTKFIKKNPEVLASELGEVLVHSTYVASYSVVKGFLNIVLSDQAWIYLAKGLDSIGYTNPNPEDIVLEYCGPNTNKPLHIGHLRNVFLGYSVGEILKEVGHAVHKVNINNDRGIAICKSMIAYSLYGNQETPITAKMKGDFLVGKYYVKYNDVLKAEASKLVVQGYTEEEAENQAPIALAAKDMLLKWEEGDPAVMKLWEMMNGWFYEGLHQTLRKLHIDFEREYYESQEYKKGKEIVEIGYSKGVFQKDESGAIYIDLTSKGLDKKFLQRANGTSIYITQDMALVKKRYEDFKMDRMIYTVGDEQNYHFKVLGYIMEAMQEPFSKNIYHLSYGMVTSKDGSKFKSREGTTADADTIIDDVVLEAKNQTLESKKSIQIEESYLDELSEVLGIGAMKFAMLRINPKKTIPFDPKEAVDLHGDTGTFVQYSFVRSKAILTKYSETIVKPEFKNSKFNLEERALIAHLYTFSSHLKHAEQGYDPSEIAHFALQLAKLFNRFYTQHPILSVDNQILKFERIYLCSITSYYLEKSLNLLGIVAPERM